MKRPTVKYSILVKRISYRWFCFSSIAVKRTLSKTTKRSALQDSQLPIWLFNSVSIIATPASAHNSGILLHQQNSAQSWIWVRGLRWGATASCPLFFIFIFTFLFLSVPIRKFWASWAAGAELALNWHWCSVRCFLAFLSAFQLGGAELAGTWKTVRNSRKLAHRRSSVRADRCLLWEEQQRAHGTAQQQYGSSPPPVPSPALRVLFLLLFIFLFYFFSLQIFYEALPAQHIIFICATRRCCSFIPLTISLFSFGLWLSFFLSFPFLSSVFCSLNLYINFVH